MAIELWERQPDRCCYMRKVIPLRETLSSATAWLSGLRREQSPSRSQTNFINKDETFNRLKYVHSFIGHGQIFGIMLKNINCPTIHFMIKAIQVLVAAPCTFPGDTTTGSRSGRWANQTKTECGLHQEIP